MKVRIVITAAFPKYAICSIETIKHAFACARYDFAKSNTKELQYYKEFDTIKEARIAMHQVWNWLKYQDLLSKGDYITARRTLLAYDAAFAKVEPITH